MYHLDGSDDLLKMANKIMVIRAHLHQRGAGPPAGAGSVFRAGRVFTLARVRMQFNFTGAPFRGTGSLIYKYRPISAPYSCGSRRRIAPWAISAGARRGPTLPPRRCKQHHTIPSNRFTAEPAGGTCGRDPLGRPARFPRWCKCPLILSPMPMRSPCSLYVHIWLATVPQSWKWCRSVLN